jgi:S1-C subfamily serine protease
MAGIDPATDRPVTRRIACFHNLDGERAIEIVSVDQDSPAKRTGLHLGDFIVVVNNIRVGSVDDLHRILSEWAVGDALTLTILRRTELLEVEAVPTEGQAGR